MFEIKAKGKKAEIFLYDAIGESFFGGTPAATFVRELAKIKGARQIDLRLNSPGGDVFDGQAIYNALVRHDARIETWVDGVAASIASVVALAGDTIHMADNSMMMIHEPWGFANGTAGDMRKMAGTLDKVHGTIQAVYTNRTGSPAAEIDALMSAETWMGAAEAVSRGFADDVTEPQQIAAADVSAFAYRHAPETLVHPGTPRLDSYRARLDKLKIQPA